MFFLQIRLFNKKMSSHVKKTYLSKVFFGELRFFKFSVVIFRVVVVFLAFRVFSSDTPFYHESRCVLRYSPPVAD